MDTEENRRKRLKQLIDTEFDGVQRNMVSSFGLNSGELSRILSGKKAFGERKARNLENILGLRSGYFDGNGTAISRVADNGEAESDNARFLALDVMASCGSGHINGDHPETIKELVMPNEKALELIGTTNRLGNICIIDAVGDSMIPTINPGDQLFIDTRVRDYIGQGVYILLHGGELICKRLSMVGKNISVSSDNKFYESWPWNDRPDETMIVGKLVRSLPIDFKIY